MTVTGTAVTASNEPLDRDADVKAYLRLDASDSDENDVLDGLITAARQHAEEFLRRALVTQTRTLTLDAFPEAPYSNRRSVQPATPSSSARWTEIAVPFPPLRSVTSIAYVDSAGATQTLASTVYTVHTGEGDSRSKGRICLAYGQTWPATRYQKGAVTVTYSCGYGSASDVPRAIKQGMLWLIGHMYENREAVAEKVGDVLPLAVDRIWAPYRIVEMI